MSRIDEQQTQHEVTTEETTDARRRFEGLPARLAVELVIGLALAAIILLAAWTSSNAIHFVYGGY